MRINDILGESKPAGKIRKSHKTVSQGAIKMRDTGGYDRTYHLNRIMMAAGMADGKSTKPVDMDSASWYEKYNTAQPYTDEEYKMIQSAMKTIPTDGKIADKRHKSKEPDYVHKTSPVPNRATLSESVSLKTTLDSIATDIGDPVAALYDTLSFQLRKYAAAHHGDLEKWGLVSGGYTSRWYDTFYFNKIQKELYDLIKFAPGASKEIKEYLSKNFRSFSDISRFLPELLVKAGTHFKHRLMITNANKWITDRAAYRALIVSLKAEYGEIDDDDEPTVDPRIAAHDKREKSKMSAAAQQNQQVEAIINQVLMRLPKDVAGDVRNAIARSPNKLQALELELKKRNIKLSESLDDFRKNLSNQVKSGVAQKHADVAIQSASNPGQWKWDKDDIIFSPERGKTYVVLKRYYDKRQGKAKYLVRGKDEETMFDAALAHKNLVKINNESATVGATSSGNIATVPNPHVSPGAARGKKSYTGSPGKSGTKAPAQPKPKSQKPTDNALNMKGTSIFGGPAIKR